MRAMLWKEWREMFRWGVLGLFVMSLVFLLAVLAGNGVFFTTLWWSSVTSWGASVVALFLGLLQSLPETDLARRALLVHRPRSRTSLYLAKVMTGLAYYILMVGLPFGVTVAWAAVPGHLAEPFLWKLILPGAADVTCGLVFYFVGLFIGFNASRSNGAALSLGLAIGCSWFVVQTPSFSGAVIAALLASVVLCAAAWGSFLGGGSYEAQPAVGGFATGLSVLGGLLAIGSVCLFAGLRAYVAYADERGSDSSEFISYELDQAGSPFRVSRRGGETFVAGIDGEPRVRTQEATESENFVSYAEVNRVLSFWTASHYRRPDTFLTTLLTTDSIRWCFVEPYGPIAVYDVDHRTPVGFIGTEGFVPVDSVSEAEGVDALFAGEFRGRLLRRSSLGTFDTRWFDALVLSDGIYKPDLDQKRLQTIYQAPVGESIVTAWLFDGVESDSRDDAIAVLLPRRLVVLAPEKGYKQAFSIPLESRADEYSLLRFAPLADRRLALWLFDSRSTASDSPEKPSLLVVYDAEGRELIRRQVPPRPRARQGISALLGLAYPVGVLALCVVNDRFVGRELPYLLEVIPFDGIFLFVAVLAACVSAGICWLIARRCALSTTRQLTWASIGFLFSPVAVPLMLSLVDRPFREACPVCRKPRVVTRLRCEHCGGPFARHRVHGTEVLEAGRT